MSIWFLCYLIGLGGMIFICTQIERFGRIYAVIMFDVLLVQDTVTVYFAFRLCKYIVLMSKAFVFIL